MRISLIKFLILAEEILKLFLLILDYLNSLIIIFMQGFVLFLGLIESNKSLAHLFIDVFERVNFLIKIVFLSFDEIIFFFFESGD